MGLDSDRFFGDQHSPFICAVCLDVVEDAIVTPCDHLFCGACFTPGRCPTCRSNVTSKQTKPMGRVLRTIYEGLKLKCSFVNCDQEVTVANCKSHEESCPRKFNLCPTCGYNDVSPDHDCIRCLKDKIAALELQLADTSGTGCGCQQVDKGKTYMRTNKHNGRNSMRRHGNVFVSKQ